MLQSNATAHREHRKMLVISEAARLRKTAVYQITAGMKSWQEQNGQSSGGERRQETAGVGTAGVSRGPMAKATVSRDDVTNNK